jgi:iron(III) transport system ATP-binding protein
VAWITVEHIAKQFSGAAHPAVRDLALEVEQGELVAILGPSGCGKTTALRCIAGLETPDRGEIRIGTDTVFSADRSVNLQPERRQLGMVFQSYAVWPHMSVLENVAYPLSVKRLPRAEMKARVSEILRTVALNGYEDRFPGQLSGGQQQRVALARALVAHPKAMLFDEPLSNLDAKLREQMRFELLELQQRLHFTALYVTHDREEAMTMASRLMVMREGEVEQIGTPLDVYERPNSAFVADFLGAIDFIPGVLLKKPDDGGYATVRSVCGVIRARASGSAAGLVEGSDVSVGIRPHWVKLLPPNEGDPNVAEIRYVVRLGSRTTFVLACHDTELRAEIPGRADRSVGDRVSIELPPDQCHMFAAARQVI